MAHVLYTFKARFLTKILHLLPYQLRILTHIIQTMFTLTRNKEAAGSNKNIFIVKNKLSNLLDLTEKQRQ
jgi:hypothetical protein